MSKLLVTLSDGGRRNAGFVGQEGDCVVRAICNTTALPYQQVYQRCALINARLKPEAIPTQSVAERLYLASAICGKASCANGVIIDVPEMKAYLEELGFVRHDYFRAEIGDWADKPGRWLIRLYMHMTAAIDGVLVDTFDPQIDYDTRRYGVGTAWEYKG